MTSEGEVVATNGASRFLFEAGLVTATETMSGEQSANVSESQAEEDIRSGTADLDQPNEGSNDGAGNMPQGQEPVDGESKRTGGKGRRKLNGGI